MKDLSILEHASWSIYKTLISSTYRCFMSNFGLIGQGISDKLFQKCEQRTDDRRRVPAYPISLLVSFRLG